MGILFDIGGAKARIGELEEQSGVPGFWDDAQRSQVVLQEIAELRRRITTFEGLCAQHEDISVLIELGEEEGDEGVYAEAAGLFFAFSKEFEKMRIATMLSGVHDRNNAIVSLHAGAGGTESCDWTHMLVRMYTRWAHKRGFSVDVLDHLPGDEAGTKSCTMLVQGENAYGYLQAEHGVHRLVRISPFDASGKRHTSFASCDVMPELDDVVMEINPDDLRIDTYRAGGAGGQHVNKTESAIRITHVPTGVVVQCQNERSQHKNREYAMKMLRAKLHELNMAEQDERARVIRGEVRSSSFGSQIRNYVFHPYSLVKDLRTTHESGNPAAVLDGDLDPFINAFLIAKAQGLTR